MKPIGLQDWAGVEDQPPQFLAGPVADHAGPPQPAASTPTENNAAIASAVHFFAFNTIIASPLLELIHLNIRPNNNDFLLHINKIRRKI